MNLTKQEKLAVDLSLTYNAAIDAGLPEPWLEVAQLSNRHTLPWKIGFYIVVATHIATCAFIAGTIKHWW